jgi:small subunit ribosomal protein S15
LREASWLKRFKTQSFGAYQPARKKTMLSKQKKERVIEKFKTHETDTGSPQVQIAILTEEIKELTKHLQAHKQDFSSRRGLIKKVCDRRKLLKYLKREDEKAHDKFMEELKI